MTIPNAGKQGAQGARLSKIGQLVVPVLQDLMRAATNDVDATIKRSLERAAQIGRFDRAYVMRLGTDGVAWDCMHEWAVPDALPAKNLLQGRPVADGALWQRLRLAGGIIHVPDVRALPDAAPEKAFLARHNIRSWLAVGIRDDAGLLSGFIGYDAFERPLTLADDDVFLLETISCGIAARLMRLTAADATETARQVLEASRDQLRATPDATPDLMMELDADGCFADWHTTSPDLMYAPPQMFIGKRLEEVLPPDVAVIGRRAMAEADASGTSQRHRYRLVHPSGAQWYELIGTRRVVTDSTDAAKLPTPGYVFVIRLITDTVLTQELLAYRDDILSTLFDLSPIGIILNDRDTGRFLDANQAFLAAGGWTREDVLVRSFADLVALDCLPLAVRALDDLTNTGRYGPLEKDYLRADGSRMSVMARGFQMTDAMGRQLIWSMVEDLSATKRAEQRLANVIDGASVGTWEWDMVSGTNTVNDRWAGMLGYTLDDLAPIDFTTWSRLLHADDQAHVSGVISQLLQRTIVSFDYTVRLRHKNGSWVWVQSRGRVLRWDANGVPLLMAGVHLDAGPLKAAEQRLENIISGAQVGTWQFDIASGLTRINDLLARMLGYQRHELEPMTVGRWRALMHPDDLATILKQRDDQFVDGQWQVENELRLRHKDGHWVWVLSRGRVTEWAADGTATVMSGVYVDIGPRKALEATLETERNFLSRLMETSVSGIAALDNDGRIVFLNREAERILGYDRTKLLGMVCDPRAFGFAHPDGTPMEKADVPYMQAMTMKKAVRGVQLAFTDGNGRHRVLLMNAAPLDAPGIAARVVCSINDVTEAAAAELNLHAAIERAETASRAKSEFLANMSHEIRTPLNGVLGMAELLGATLTMPEQQKMLETIQQSGALLLSIINDILDLAKIESGHVVLEALPFCPADLAARVVDLHAPAARAKGLHLLLQTDPGARLTRLGDAPRILQLLHNLVGNAVKFTETGTVRLAITVPAQGPLLIAVADTGIGMTAAQTARVFDDFTQADGTITRRFGGTGLGLPIVRRLVGLMGGDITLHSAPDVGTTVDVRLPLALAADSGAMQGNGGDLPVPIFGHLHVLVAEDNATNRVILQTMLTSLGIRVTMVEDGDEAVLAWSPGRYDLLLLDIAMPRKDGVTALHDIIAKAAIMGAVTPPAIAVTANAMTHHVAQYLAEGFADCVAKPLALADLGRAIAGAIAMSQ